MPILAGQQPPTSRIGFGPLSPAERIESLDTLRGMALLMILIANMPAFNSPVYYLADAEQQWSTSHVDHIADTFVRTFIDYESVAVFSFLLGFGFAMQLLRAYAVGQSFLVLYVRRLLALIAIGVVHILLIWTGDILLLYGILGFPLLLFRRFPPKLILAVAIVLYLVSPIRWELSVVRHLREDTAGVSTSADVTAEAQADRERAREQVKSSVQAYAHGSWTEIAAQRIRDYLYYVKHNQAMTVFPMFLFGLFAGRSKLFENLVSRRRGFRTALVCSASLAFPLIALLRVLYLPGLPAWTALLRPAVFAVEHAALVVFYISWIIWLQGRVKWRLLSAIAAAGRLSLTNYLLQSVLCTLIFYRYGLGLYGQIGSAPGLFIALGVFALQLWLSVLWSRHFRLGPVESVLRSVSYGRVQALRS